MPIYEYICAECHEAFEKIVSQDELVVCPECKSERLEKQYSRFGMATPNGSYPSLPLYKSGGCGCGAGGCGCSCRN